MLRADLVGKLVDGTGLTKGAAESFLSRLSFIIQEEVATGNEVHITSIGTFFASVRKKRTVADPNDSSKMIEVPSMSIVRFSASKQLKRAARHSGKTVCKQPSTPPQSSSSPSAIATG
jgi:nucleoid DNA-binding protein